MAPPQVLRTGFLLLPALVLSAPRAAGRASWLRIENDDAQMLTDAPQKDAVEFLVGYSAFRHVFVEWLAPPGRRPPPARLTLFRDWPTVHRCCCSRVTEAGKRDIAVSMDIDSTAVSALSLEDDREAAMQMTFLFDTIWSLNRVGYFLPLWASQGTGEVLSSLRVNKGFCILGEDPGCYRRTLNDERWYPWPEFSDITTDSPAYRKMERSGVYYAQAWAMMHLVLLDSPTGARSGSPR